MSAYTSVIRRPSGSCMDCSRFDTQAYVTRPPCGSSTIRTCCPVNVIVVRFTRGSMTVIGGNPIVLVYVVRCPSGIISLDTP